MSGGVGAEARVSWMGKAARRVPISGASSFPLLLPSFFSLSSHIRSTVLRIHCYCYPLIIPPPIPPSPFLSLSPAKHWRNTAKYGAVRDFLSLFCLSIHRLCDSTFARIFLYFFSFPPGFSRPPMSPRALVSEQRRPWPAPQAAAMTAETQRHSHSHSRRCRHRPASGQRP